MMQRQWARSKTIEPLIPSSHVLSMLDLLKRTSDERESWPISSVNKIGQQKSVVCHAKIGRICLPPKSPDFIVQVEHVLFSTRKSPNFLECRVVIGQQSVYTTNLRYRIHAVDVCSYTPKYADQLTLKQMHDQQITYLSSNRRRTHTVRFLCCYAVAMASNIEACAYLSSAIFLSSLP